MVGGGKGGGKGGGGCKALLVKPRKLFYTFFPISKFYKILFLYMFVKNEKSRILFPSRGRDWYLQVCQ